MLPITVHHVALLAAIALGTTACTSSGSSPSDETSAPDSAEPSAADGAQADEGSVAEADPGTPQADTTPEPDEEPAPVAVEHVAGRVDHLVEDINGRMVSLQDYRGDVLMIVNTASRCGFTGQYEGLQQLHETYAANGLRILGFPANDFAGQEPGSNEEIAEFCSREFGVGFQMFAKVEVTGNKTHDLYRTLTEESPESFRGPIAWNFTKFLVDSNGFVIARFPPATEPNDPAVIAAIEAALAAR